jgi:hypothetical protein
MSERQFEINSRVLEPDDPQRKAVEALAVEINAVFHGQEIDTVLNSMAFTLANFMTDKSEDERQKLLAVFVDVVKANTRNMAGEATA